MSDARLAAALFVGFALAAAILLHVFLRVTRSARSAWIAALLALAFFAALGWALAEWVLPGLGRLQPR